MNIQEFTEKYLASYHPDATIKERTTIGTAVNIGFQFAASSPSHAAQDRPTEDEIYEIGKKEVAYDRQEAICGKKDADMVHYFWLKGYKYATANSPQPLPAQDKTVEGEDCPYCGYFKPCSNCLAKKEQAASTTPTPEGMITSDQAETIYEYLRVNDLIPIGDAVRKRKICEAIQFISSAFTTTPISDEGRTAEGVLKAKAYEKGWDSSVTHDKFTREVVLPAMEEYASSRPTQQTPTQEEIVKVMREVGKNENADQYTSYQDYAAAIHALYSGGREESKWISVEERLPDSLQSVLCIIRGSERYMVNSYATACDQDEEWFKLKFSHWQPLPLRKPEISGHE